MTEWPERDSQAVGLFEERYGASRIGTGVAGLLELLDRFSHLPYENLTKILAWDGGLRPPAPRGPRRVMEDHLALGTGGTCFSLTELLRQLVQQAGLACHPVMAHMRHGANVHCALRVELHGRGYLVDPGYLVRQPQPLTRTPAPFERERPGQARLVPAGSLPGVPDGVPDGDFDLYTLEQEGPRWRYRFADRAPTLEAFLHHWLASFRQPGMRSLLVTQRDGGDRLYLHNHKLRSRGPGGAVNRNVRQSLDRVVQEVFGIDPGVTAAAHRLLERGRHGP